MKQIKNLIFIGLLCLSGMAWSQDNEVYIEQLDNSNSTEVYIGMDGGTAMDNVLIASQSGSAIASLLMSERMIQKEKPVG